MLGIAVPPVVPLGGTGGTAETIVAIVASALLVAGVAVWIWMMVRRPKVGTTFELPLREERKAA